MSRIPAFSNRKGRRHSPGRATPFVYRRRGENVDAEGPEAGDSRRQFPRRMQDGLSAASSRERDGQGHSIRAGTAASSRGIHFHLRSRPARTVLPMRQGHRRRVTPKTRVPEASSGVAQGGDSHVAGSRSVGLVARSVTARAFNRKRRCPRRWARAFPPRRETIRWCRSRCSESPGRRSALSERFGCWRPFAPPRLAGWCR